MPMFVFFVAVIAVVLVISFFYMVKAGAAMLVHVRRGTNCDDSATERFLELVSMMKNKGELVIHDDGTDTETTLYNDPRVVETLDRAHTGGGQGSMSIQRGCRDCGDEDRGHKGPYPARWRGMAEQGPLQDRRFR